MKQTTDFHIYFFLLLGKIHCYNIKTKIMTDMINILVEENKK